MIKNKTRLLYGFAINDAPYKVTSSRLVNGKSKIVWTCPFYIKWTSMLSRCYGKNLSEKHPTYLGCTVCEEWLTFSNFRLWMEQQDWQGKHLDKDLLIKGNKIYSPDLCCFISPEVNLFLTEATNSRGIYPIGVTFHKKRNKFRADCRSVLEFRSKHLGFFDSPDEAHKAWVDFKLKQAKILADQESDPRIKSALIERYTNYDGN